MHDLQINTAELKTAGDHRYYIFPAPVTHKNQKDRPSAYADESKLKTYAGRGSNGSARLLPDVLNPANLFMAALLDYGTEIDDWSLKRHHRERLPAGRRKPGKHIPSNNQGHHR